MRSLPCFVPCHEPWESVSFLNMRNPLKPVSIAICSLSLLACAPRTGVETAGTEQAQERARVEVENQRLYDINVYLLNSGQRVRLGRISAKRTAQFTLPPGVVPRAREVEFMIESLSGSSAAVSQRLWVAPGELVKLIVTQ
jgi:hypothetical protein